jgi:hypothetical protein
VAVQRAVGVLQRGHARERRRLAATGELRIADQRLLDENTTYTLKVSVSDGFRVQQGDHLHPVDDGAIGGA